MRENDRSMQKTHALASVLSILLVTCGAHTSSAQQPSPGSALIVAQDRSTTERSRMPSASATAVSAERVAAAAEASCKDHRGAEVHKHSGSEAKHVVMLSERCGDYSVSRDGKVVYAGETLGTLDVSMAGNPNVALLLSTPSPLRGLQYALLWDGDSGGGYSAYVIDPSAKRIVVRNVVTGKIRVESVIRWSPAENYAVVPVIGEVQTEIVAIDLAKVTSPRFFVAI